MVYFTSAQAEAIRNRFGKAFLDGLHESAGRCAARWLLSDLSFIESYSVNCIFTCVSEIFGAAVLKIGRPSREAYTEYAALREYDGFRFCRAFDADLENGVMLEEWIRPGIPLRDEPSLERRVEIFCGLHKGLHRMPATPERYPTYTEWVSDISEFMRHQTEYAQLARHMNRAEDLCGELAGEYPGAYLLHGDFHHDNILRNGRGGYTIIDPKGVVGHPISDIPRFILNEFGDAVTDEMRTRILAVIAQIHRELDIPADVIRKCLFIETAMAHSWSVESAEEPNMAFVRFAEELLTEG